MDKNKGHYDYSKSFAEQIDDLKAGKFAKGQAFILGSTPNIYKKIGLSALPMTMEQTPVDYALNGTKNADHQLGEELLRQLPDLIKKLLPSSNPLPSQTIVQLLLYVER